MENNILNSSVQNLVENLNGLEQEKAIIEVIQHYFEGAKSGNTTLIHRAFDKNAKLKHVKADGSLYEADLQHFITYLETNKGMPVLETHILSIDIVSSIANAKVLFVFQDFIYVDFLNILQVEDDWKIVDKVYFRKEKENML